MRSAEIQCAALGACSCALLFSGCPDRSRCSVVRRQSPHFLPRTHNLPTEVLTVTALAALPVRACAAAALLHTWTRSGRHPPAPTTGPSGAPAWTPSWSPAAPLAAVPSSTAPPSPPLQCSAASASRCRRTSGRRGRRAPGAAARAAVTLTFLRSTRTTPWVSKRSRPAAAVCVIALQWQPQWQCNVIRLILTEWLSFAGPVVRGRRAL